MGGLLPNGSMNIYKGTFTLNKGEKHDITIGTASLLLLFTPSSHNPLVAIIPAQWNDNISTIFNNNLFILNQENDSGICVFKKGNITTILNNGGNGLNFSYLFISLIAV